MIILSTPTLQVRKLMLREAERSLPKVTAVKKM